MLCVFWGWAFVNIDFVYTINLQNAFLAPQILLFHIQFFQSSVALDIYEITKGANVGLWGEKNPVYNAFYS